MTTTLSSLSNFDSRMFAACLLLSCLIASAVTNAQPADRVLVDDLGLQRNGHGVLRWFGITVYEASLWSRDKKFSGLPASSPVALNITYRRAISRDRLLEATEGQWRRLARVDESLRKSWLEQLAQLWPDVSPGDNIICIVYPHGETRFYTQDGPLGVLRDELFGTEFLAIWLDPRARHQDLRARLIGDAADRQI